MVRVLIVDRRIIHRSAAVSAFCTSGRLQNIAQPISEYVAVCWFVGDVS